MKQNQAGMLSGVLMWFLFVILATLKITGVVGWSWWIITMPLWISLAAGLAMFLVGLVIILIGAITAAIVKAARR